MIIGPKELNKEFRKVIRSIDRTSKWQNKGARRYWDLEGEIWVGLEQIYNDKMTTREDIFVTYALLISCPFDNEPYSYDPSISVNEGRVTLQLNLDIEDKKILGSDKEDRRKISSKLGLDRDNLLFKDTVISRLGEWELAYRNKESIAKYLEKALQLENAFWVIREQHGNTITKKRFLEYLKSNPFARPNERLTGWLEKVGVINIDTKKNIDRAAMQAQDRIPEFMRAVIAELELQT